MLNKFFTALDPASQLTIKRIAVTLAIAVALSLFAEPYYRLSFFVGLCGLAVFVSGVLAMRAKQRLNAPELNHWDETTFFALLTFLFMPFVTE